MARPKSGKGAAKAAAALTPEAAAKVAELSAAGKSSLEKKDFSKALEAFDQATKIAADGPAAEKSELLLGKAECLMSLKKYKEAVKECSAVLDLQPGSAAALMNRSRGYEQMGFLKQALSDVQALNKTDSASDETRAVEKRLKEQMSTSKVSAQASSGSSSSSGAIQQQQQQQQRANAAPQYPYYITVKCNHNGETKLVHTQLLVSYADLYDLVKQKFPKAGPFLLRYTNAEGTTVTIASRLELQAALGEAIALFQKQAPSTPKGMAPQLPPLKVEVVACTEAEVPPPPAAEVQARIETEKNYQQAKKEAEAAQAAAQGANKVEYELDEWLIDFSRHFTAATGIDPPANPEQANLGQDKLQRALDSALSVKAAMPLFDKAAEHFRDATCTSLIQWGNVHIVKADRRAQVLLREGKAVDNDTLKAMMADYNETEAKIKQALAIRADSWEATGSMAQLEWERLKAKLGYIVPVAQPDEASTQGKSPEQLAQEAQAHMAEALGKVLGKLDAKAVKGVQSYMDSANKWFDKALAYAKAAEEAKKQHDAEVAAASGKEEKKPELTPEQQAQQQLSSPSGNMLVMHGNILYEWSQILAAVGQPWKPTLDTAVEKFRTAGAAEAEVRSALKNHTRKAELDLGPDPEPEAPAAPAAPAAAAPAAPAEEKPHAKGLPSLDIKKKGGK